MRVVVTLVMMMLIGGGLSLAAYMIVSQVPAWSQRGRPLPVWLRLAIVASYQFLHYWFYTIPIVGLLCYWIARFITDPSRAKRNEKAS